MLQLLKKTEHTYKKIAGNRNFMKTKGAQLKKHQANGSPVLGSKCTALEYWKV